MKSKFPVRSLLSLLLAVTVVSIAVPAGRVFAQSSAEDRKIRLMADVLRLRDAGDYAGALIQASLGLGRLATWNEKEEQELSSQVNKIWEQLLSKNVSK